MLIMEDDSSTYLNQVMDEKKLDIGQYEESEETKEDTAKETDQENGNI